MLDIRLLELSGGKRGLREVFLELLDKYGKDKTFPEDDFFKLFVDMKSFLYLTGTEVDFSDGLMGRGFVFNNPNAKKTCGCGSSFGV